MARLGDIVEVTWEDAFLTVGWMPDKEAADVAANDSKIASTVGYLYYQDKRRLSVVGQMIKKDGDKDIIMTIPRGMVRKLEVLKRKGVKADGRSSSSGNGGLCEPSPLRPEREDSGGE